MSKYLHLTAVKKELSEEADRKIKEWEDMDNGSEPVCHNGHTRQYYEDLNITKLPESLIAAEKELNKPLDLDEDTDYVYEYSHAVVDLKQFKFAVNIDEDEELGCEVWLKDNAKMSVAESAIQIYFQIENLERNWLTRIKDIVIDKCSELYKKIRIKWKELSQKK